MATGWRTNTPCSSRTTSFPRRRLVDADRTLLFADNEKLYEAAILIDGQGAIKAGEVRVVDEGLRRRRQSRAQAERPHARARQLDLQRQVRPPLQEGQRVWVKEKTEERGQWGISQDDYGRIFTNSNSNLISVEEIAPGQKSRNPAYAFRTRSTARSRTSNSGRRGSIPGSTAAT